MTRADEMLRGQGSILSLRRERCAAAAGEPLSFVRIAAVGLSCLLTACGAEGEAPQGSAAGGGSMGISGGTGGASTGGASTGGASTGGASTGGTSSGGGTPIGGNSGANGGGGADPVGGTGSGGSSSGGTAGTGNGAGTLALTSPAFDDVPGCSVENPTPCDVFPDENVSYMDHANISPELRWTGVPSGTQSFAIVLLDAFYGQAHWVLWNIPADATLLAANVPKDTAMPATPAGARQCNANFATQGGDGYFGPHLPCNVFQFEIYALSISTFSPMKPESAALVWIELQELGDPVLGLAKLTARSNDYMMTCE